MRVVATLTTIPKRIKYIKPILKSLVKQTHKFDVIYLNIPLKSNKGQKYNIPKDLLDGFPKDLVKIVRCVKDYGPITKLIPTLYHETDPETFIVIFDDDQIVHRNVNKLLIEKSQKYPNSALSFSGWCIGIFPFLFQPLKTNKKDVEVDWIQGSDSIFIKRRFIDIDKILDYSGFPIHKFTRNDDHWISYNLDINHINRIKIDRDATDYFKPSSNTQIEPLSRSIRFIPDIFHISFILKKRGVYKRNAGIISTFSHRSHFPMLVISLFLIILGKILK